MPTPHESADQSRIGRISTTQSDPVARAAEQAATYDPSRPEEEYGNTDKFRDAKLIKLAGGEDAKKINRYPGKCVNCSTSIAPGKGEVVHISKVPQEKRRGVGQWAVRCTDGSCLNASGQVKGPAERTTTPAQGVKFQRAKIGKAGGGRNVISVEHPPNSGQVSSITWHPRSGVETVNQHPGHGDDVINFLRSTAESEAARQGASTPRPKKARGKKK